MKKMHREFRETKEHFALRVQSAQLKEKAEELAKALEVENLPREKKEDLTYQLALINRELEKLWWTE